MIDRDRLLHLMIELEWADREHPEFIRILRDPTKEPWQAATDCQDYARSLPTEWGTR